MLLLLFLTSVFVFRRRIVPAWHLGPVWGEGPGNPRGVHHGHRGQAAVCWETHGDRWEDCTQCCCWVGKVTDSVTDSSSPLLHWPQTKWVKGSCSGPLMHFGVRRCSDERENAANRHFHRDGFIFQSIVFVPHEALSLWHTSSPCTCSLSSSSRKLALPALFLGSLTRAHPAGVCCTPGSGADRVPGDAALGLCSGGSGLRSVCQQGKAGGDGSEGQNKYY